MRIVLQSVLAAEVILACAIVPAPPAPAATYDQWRKFPYPPGRAEYFKDIGLEEGDVLWVTAGTTIGYWDGKQFRLPENVEFVSGSYFTWFCGGPDRGLYSVRKSNRLPQVFRLSDGRAIYVADVHYEPSADPPPFYVARSGKLFNWGKDFLAVFTGQDWEKSEAALDTAYPRIFDNGRSVWFYHAGKLYGVEDNGRVCQTDLPIEFPGRRPHTRGTLWGDDRAIFLAHGGRGIKAANLATGEMLDTEPINEAFGDRSVWDLFSAPDGAVWVLANDKELRSYVFMRVAPDGSVERITAAAGLPFNNHQFWRSPHTAMFAADGAVWFGLHDAPLVRMHHGRVRQFGETGLDLSGCRKLLEDRHGRVYALTSHGVYVTAPKSLGSFAVLPEPPKPKPLEEVAWKLEPDRCAWLGPNRIALASPNSDGLWFFDSATGQRVATLEIAGFGGRSSWLAPGGQPHQVLALATKRLLVVDASKARLDLQIDYPLDSRVAPVPVGDDFFVAKGYRSRELALLDREGKAQWTCRLPGYVHAQLAVCGAFGVVQTRGSSYGGQKTLGVDLNSGRVLWSDTTNAYGYGAVFADDAKYVVEADKWLSPPANEGRLICRDARTGERRWEYARPGTISHCPALDLQTDRLYAVFDRGEVVCLEGPTGKLVWEAALPENPYPALSPSYDPAWTAIALEEDQVLVVDRRRVLHVFRAEDGQRLAGFDLTSAFRGAGKSQRQVNLLCMPQFKGRLLLVATDRGLAGYRFDRKEAYRQLRREDEEEVRTPAGREVLPSPVPSCLRRRRSARLNRPPPRTGRCRRGSSSSPRERSRCPCLPPPERPRPAPCTPPGGVGGVGGWPRWPRRRPCR
jgi:hypothetical protein